MEQGKWLGVGFGWGMKGGHSAETPDSKKRRVGYGVERKRCLGCLKVVGSTQWIRVERLARIEY